jgi:hypothetical protein
MHIHWKPGNIKKSERIAELLLLEYRVRQFLTTALIKDAEHLLDYMEFISLDLETDQKCITVSRETPEPFYSLLNKQLKGFEAEATLQYS